MTAWKTRPATRTDTDPNIVTVFNYRVFDPQSCEMQVATRKATLEAIAKIALAEPLAGTSEEVPRSALDAQGCYRRVATAWGELA
ncbi:MAG: hypothetical protein QE285_03345 [Aquabacterium sp.]|nr:hypothetical protein [Aquabacterium sp.]